MLETLAFLLYQHRDFLHFQLDQSRDSLLIKEVYEKGISSLPLLGPRAGGSFLRLGPFYYYLLYLTVLITRSTDPSVFAIPDILAGVLLVPALYVLLKKILNSKWSLITTFLAVNSTFLITYDRFSWNPNMMPLFSALAMYAFLRYFETKKQGEKKSVWKWAGILGLVVGFFTQLHFVAFVALPIVFGLTFVVFILKSKFVDKSPEITVKKFILDIVIFLAVFTLTQAPIIVNEVRTGGINTKELFRTVAKKQDKDTSHSTKEKLVQNLWVYPKGFWISTMGNIDIDYPTWRINPIFDIRCDLFCRSNISTTALASIYWIFPILIFFSVFYKKTRELLQPERIKQKTKNLSRKWNLLALTFIWIMVPWWAFYSLSFSLRPRFFLFSVVPFWIVIGIFLQDLSKKSLGKYIAITIAVLILASNYFETWKRFDILQSASREMRTSYPKDLMIFQDESYPVTLREQENISNWIREKYELEGLGKGKEGIFMWAPSFYYRPLIYFLDQKELTGSVHYFTSYPSSVNGDYYAVTQTGSPQDFFGGKKTNLFTKDETKSFGTLTVYHMSLTDQGKIEATQREKKHIRSKEEIQNIDARCRKTPKPTCRFTWGDVL